MRSILTRLLILLMLVLLAGCNDSPDRHLKLGRWYAQKGLVDEAILEYREVTRLYPTNYRELSRDDFQTLSRAHYNLALMYTKKGWWDYALKEAETCFELQPTKDNYELVVLIKKRASLETETSDT